MAEPDITSIAITARRDPWDIPLSDPSVSNVTRLTRQEAKEVFFPHKTTLAKLTAMGSLMTDTAMTYALVGHQCGEPWSKLEAQLKVCAGEWKEMEDAVEARDSNMLRDAIGDLLYTVVGMAWRAGIPFMEDFEQVVQSNLTKFDVNPEEAAQTAEKYLALGITTRCEKIIFRRDNGDFARTYYVTFVDGDQVDSNGKDYPNGKWMKSVNFKDINLPPLSPQHALELTSHTQMVRSLENARQLLVDSKRDGAAEILATAYATIILHEQLTGRANFESDTARRLAECVLSSTFALDRTLSEDAITWAYSTARWIESTAEHGSGDEGLADRQLQMKVFLRSIVEQAVPGFFQGLSGISHVAKDDPNAEVMLHEMISSGLKRIGASMSVTAEYRLIQSLYAFLFGD